MPYRRCVGCGQIAPKSELLRIAAAPAEPSTRARAVVDPLARMPGRGAYLCRVQGSARPLESCLRQAERRAAIARGLRRPIPGGLVLEDLKRLESVGR